MGTPAVMSAPNSALYRRVWRWHFYAGLICLPVLALMAATGALYLFKQEIDARLYAGLRHVRPGPAPALAPALLIERALAAVPGEAQRFVAPADAGRSAEVGVRTPAGIVAVFLHPADGQVLGTLGDDGRLMEIVKRVHSLTIAGPVANLGVEIVAGWAVVLAVSGVFLWWPRGRSGGVASLRGRPAQRTWWRDLHAVTGTVAALAIVFLAITGMPWSAFWGQQYGRLTAELGWGMPRFVWGPGPQSAAPVLKALPAVPWVAEHAPLPQSQPRPHAPHGRHDHHGPGDASETGAAPPRPVADLGLDGALQRFAALGLPPGTPVRLPDGARGVYTAVSFPDDVRGQRVVHLDRYSGAVLADVGYAQYGGAARVTQWGIALHTGRQFGLANQLVMLAGCLAVLLLAASAVVMWWKRRPRGRLAAPARRAGDRAAWGALAVAAALGTVYPLLGASMLVACAVDALVPERWHRRFGL